jgi:DtxR family transcriptional regulator, Mn-dependent transcriptional regulator
MPKKNESQEMYLRAIYELIEDGIPPRITEISKILGIAPASVSEMLDKMGKYGLISHVRYGKVSLTKKGRKLAAIVVRKHRILERFLHDVLKLNDVKPQACKLEHAISVEAINRLCVMIGCPKKSMAGKPIPSCSAPGKGCNCLKDLPKIRKSLPNFYARRK